MRIAPCRVGDKKTTALPHRLCKRLRAALLEDLLQTSRRLPDRGRRDKRSNTRGDIAGRASDRPAVHNQVAQVVEELRRAVALLVEVEELRAVGDEGGRRLTGQKVGVAQDVQDEGSVRLDATDARLRQRAGNLIGGRLEG